MTDDDISLGYGEGYGHCCYEHSNVSGQNDIFSTLRVESDFTIEYYEIYVRTETGSKTTRLMTLNMSDTLCVYIRQHKQCLILSA